MKDTFRTPSGRLTEEGVREIRRRRANKETYRAIADTLGVTLGTVYNVCTGRTWEWLK